MKNGDTKPNDNSKSSDDLKLEQQQQLQNHFGGVAVVAQVPLLQPQQQQQQQRGGVISLLASSTHHNQLLRTTNGGVYVTSACMRTLVKLFCLVVLGSVLVHLLFQLNERSFFLAQNVESQQAEQVEQVISPGKEYGTFDAVDNYRSLSEFPLLSSDILEPFLLQQNNRHRQILHDIQRIARSKTSRTLQKQYAAKSSDGGLKIPSINFATILECEPYPVLPYLIALVNSSFHHFILENGLSKYDITATQPNSKLSLHFHIGIPGKMEGKIASSFESLKDTKGKTIPRSKIRRVGLCGSQSNLTSTTVLELLNAIFPFDKYFIFFTLYQFKGQGDLYYTQNISSIAISKFGLQNQQFFALPVKSFISSITVATENEGQLTNSPSFYYSKFIPNIIEYGNNVVLTNSSRLSTGTATPPKQIFSYYNVSLVETAAESFGIKLFKPGRIYVFASSSVVRLAANYLIKMKKMGLVDNVCLISYDQDILEQLTPLINDTIFEDELCLEVHNNNGLSSGVLRINTLGYFEMIQWRGELIKNKLWMGESFGVNDADTSWRSQSAIDLIEKAPFCDGFWMVDLKAWSADITQAILAKSSGSGWMNGGFYFVNSNPKTRAFFASIVEFQHSSKLKREQPSFMYSLSVQKGGWVLLNSTDIEQSNSIDYHVQERDSPLKLCPLPLKNFPSGNLYFSGQRTLEYIPNKSEIYLMHYNNVRGDYKELCMALNGDWELKTVSYPSMGVYRNAEVYRCEMFV